MYNVSGVASAVDFELTAAIRTKGDPANDTSYYCPDEDVGCPYTTWVLCAANSSTTVEERIRFMGCWDDTCPGDSSFSCPPGATFCECKANATGIKKAASICSAAAKLNFSVVSACQSSGAKKLLHDAAVAFETKWPTHAHAGKYQVPHVLIDGKDISSLTVPDLLSELCANGVDDACEKTGGEPADKLVV